MRSAPDPKQETEELRELIREAHGVIKDLRQAVRDCREYERQSLAHVVVDARIGHAIEAGLEYYHGQMGMAIDAATKLVYARFDELVDILMGEDRKSADEGLDSIPEALRKREKRMRRLLEFEPIILDKLAREGNGRETLAGYPLPAPEP